MRPVHRRYVREFIPAMAAYVVVLILATWGLRHTDSTLLRMLLALAPAVPVAFVARAVLRYVRDTDELDQRILLEAGALAALVLTMGTFSLGLLAMAGVLPVRADLALLMVLPAYSGLYGLFSVWARRRYA